MSKDLDRSELLHLMSLKEVFGGFAHEIAQPLNAVMIASQVLKMKVERSVLPFEEQSFLCKRLDLIADQVRRATEIVNELRAFSRKDDPTAETGPADPKTLFEKIHSLMAQQFISRGIELTWTAEPDLPALALAPHLAESLLVLALALARDFVQTAATGPPQGTGAPPAVHVQMRAEPGFVPVRFRCVPGGHRKNGIAEAFRKDPSMTIATSLLASAGGEAQLSEDSFTIRFPAGAR